MADNQDGQQEIEYEEEDDLVEELEEGLIYLNEGLNVHLVDQESQARNYKDHDLRPRVE